MKEDKNTNKNTEKNTDGNDPQDGFDLIDYPIEYLFKAMVKVETAEQGPAAALSVTDTMLSLVLEHVDAEAVIESKSNRSRTGKFEAVSLTIRLESRAQLEAVYGALSSAPQVVMTL